ncbi:MAG: DUF4144 family protein [Colwellia sp.]|nr:DUF4144 family protein [Colwellia sp.]
MIFWPCILKLDGDNELIYLGCEHDFISECQELILTDDDLVIDSTGLSYLIEFRAKKLALVETERIFVVDEVTHLIRANEFKKAELCLTKINFSTVSDAIKSLHY